VYEKIDIPQSVEGNVLRRFLVSCKSGEINALEQYCNYEIDKNIKDGTLRRKFQIILSCHKAQYRDDARKICMHLFKGFAISNEYLL
jgi:hypothetical protein